MLDAYAPFSAMAPRGADTEQLQRTSGRGNMIVRMVTRHARDLPASGYRITDRGEQQGNRIYELAGTAAEGNALMGAFEQALADRRANQ